MKEQPHYNKLLTKKFFEKYYENKKMSFPKLERMLVNKGYNIVRGTIYKYCKRLGVKIRNSSEARRENDGNPLNYNISYLTEDILEAIDGFLLGDGGTSFNKRSKSEVARFSCGVEYKEFCYYMMNFFKEYQSTVSKPISDSMKQGYMFTGRTKTHPDIYQQYLRWYPLNDKGKRVKQPPEDVRISSLSVLIWYLGDGSIVNSKRHSITVRLATDGFFPEKVEFLVEKLKEKGIQCYRSKENRINIRAKGIPAFFNLIGRKSPIKCYNYKFDKVPFWRFESRRMKDITDELKIDYNHLSYFVKKGRISCFRASNKGRPRFLPEHIEEVKKMVKSGELF